MKKSVPHIQVVPRAEALNVLADLSLEPGSTSVPIGPEDSKEQQHPLNRRQRHKRKNGVVNVVRSR
jgi:hypothetical protein